jgi:hypothetical protein
MATAKQAKKGFIVSVVGLLFVILGVVWIMVIFPAMDKVPTDYGRSYYFDGTFSVLNPATQSMDSFPIEQVLAQKGNGTQDGALLIHEKRTVKNAANGYDLSAIYGDESTLAVDRHTLKFASEIDERHRTGCWGPPRGLGEGDTFDLYNPGVNKPLTAKYVKDDVFREMKVVIFQIDEKDISIGTDPTSHLPLLLSTTINLTIDPKTGTVVDQDSVTTTSMDMMGNKVPVQISNVNYAESTIVDLMDVAKDAQKMLLWFETVIPWVLIGVGAVLVIVDTVFIGRRRAT